MNRTLKYIALTFLLHSIFGIPLYAQNLVVNPSFENTSACPIGISEFNKALNWSASNSGNDTCSTPELYAGCAPGFGGANSPDGLMGFQRSRTGTHHAGQIVFELLSDWREYLEGTLSTPLIAGQQYCVKFYISTADESRYATNSIGLYFSNTILLKNFCTNTGPHNVTPQLTYSGSPIVDSVNWVPLEWTYTASGGEQYFTIGNFNNNNNTPIVDFNTNIGISIQPFVYFFIDDIEVTPDFCCPLIQVDSISDVSCFGNSDGKAFVSAIGGTPPISYAWSSGASGATVNNLTAGDHMVTLTDGRGCVVTKEVIIKQPANLAVSISSFSGSCGTNITATPLGGTAPYNYTWSNGLTIASINNIAAGNYTVTVVDDNNCFSTESVTVSQSGSFSATTSSTGSACSACDGTGAVTPSGGTPPYTYLWSDGQTTAAANNLCPGAYTITVTESGGSGGNLFWAEDFTNGGAGWTLNINGPGVNDADANEWVINNNVSNCSQCPASGSGGDYLHITCSSLTCTLSGDAGSCAYEQGDPFGIFSNPATDKYVISPNISTIGRTGLTLTFWYMSDGDAGKDYGLIRLSDNGGATWTDLPTQYSGVSTCTQATVSIPVGYENIPDFRLAFRWINDGDGDGSDPPFMIDDIELGGTGGSATCEIISSVNVNSSGGPSVSTVSQNDVSCFGESDGAININVTSGDPPFSYSWVNGTITTQNISGLSGGSYTVTVTDGNNCDTTLTYIIDEPQELVVSSNVTQGGCDATGAISLTVTGGVSPFNYLWSSGQTVPNISNLQAGIYVVTTTDNSGCEVVDSFIQIANGNFNIVLSPTNASCAGVSNGSVTSNVSGGFSPYQYAWSNGDSGNNPVNLDVGTYTVTITDNNNCTASESVIIGSNNQITSSASITGIQCETDSDGGIKLIPSGGTSPYSYQWSNGDSLSTLTNLSAGSYFVTVTDANGCTLDTVLALNALSVLNIQVQVTADDCNGSGNGSAQVNVLNGNAPPYTYQWNTGESTSGISGLNSGTYNVTVLDTFNCLKTTAAAIGNIVILIEDSTINESCTDNGDGEIHLEVTGGSAPYSYNWDSGESTPIRLNLSADNYNVTVADSNDCANSRTIIVSLDPEGVCDSLLIYDVFSPNGDGVNDEWIIEGIDNYQANEIQIFNRWGSLVYEATPYANGDAWNGHSKKEEPLPSATYYYILKLNDVAGTSYAGNVTIVR